MASEAYDRAMKQFESPSETQLAEMIMRDIAQLSENAQAQGVTAYVRRPVQRVRPNEHFLQGTLRSVKFANRRAEEEQMWAHRERLQQPRQAAALRTSGEDDWHNQSNRTSTDVSRSDSSGSSPANGREDAGDRGLDDVAEMLARKRPRGRGAVGPRSDEPGPFLPIGAAEDDDGWRQQPAAPTVLGPARPSWLPQPEEAASGRARDLSNAGLDVTGRAAERKARDSEGGGAADAVSRKDKKAKKKKKKKKHKDK